MIDEGLRNDIATADLNAQRVVAILDKASRYWMNGERSATDDMEIVIRLLDRASVFEEHLKGAKSIINALARQAGLFPYYKDSESTADNIARAVHKAPGLADVYFHAAQREVFSLLQSGKNLVLSAPTSFGKTLLVDALIATRKPRSVIIVVPTIALLEERRRRLHSIFPEYKIVTQAYQEIGDGPYILLGTQERILERQDLPEIELFVIDEFYKLDLTRGDLRAKTLNLLLARYIHTAAQVYLLGPSLDSNPIEQESSKFSFFKTDYSPVTANVVYVEPPGTDPDTLTEILQGVRADSSLVYCRSPKSARTASQDVIARGYGRENGQLYQIAGWLRDNYHPEWYLADALEHGTGIHHGRIPRAIASLMVQLFNKHELDVLFCTSSLIEGVNTAAKNVLIYDKYIDTRKLDRFTFNNIKGRAGRMFQHYVGNIFLFNPDAPSEPEQLDIPILSDPDRLSEETLIQLGDRNLSESNRRRREQILDRTPVPEDILARFGRYGITEIEAILEDILDLKSADDDRLLWNGVGSYKEIKASADMIWGRLNFNQHDVRSGAQFALLANRLNRNEALYDFITEGASEADQYGDIDTKIDKAFNFLRGAEYSFVEPFHLVQELVNYAFGEGACDYSKFVGDLASWGLPGRLKSLEEFGVPAPIVQRIEHYLNPEDADESLAIIRRMMDSEEVLEPVERLILSYTLEP
ncbi:MULTISPECIES: DEAD/DEAH box helicase [Salipiger]|uniref:DEAD/DEAH box helicase n=1 Tax=Salipiger TaxID=263377 RepID=UPI0008E2F355|nr:MULTISPECIES: DEAD/DEAH box helicase [Salipiger]MBN9890546.1 DEAD/DEAH box helicase [Salipiger abyssi]SFD98594.1 Helicase conserved C-terminal domain-containing protein [Salipiger profundus]